jgi:hypothetical protein
MNEEKKVTLGIIIGFETCNGDAGSFSPWNPHALKSIGVSPGALDPNDWSYHVRGDLYEVPEIARKNHECGGSVNVYGADTTCGNHIGLSHVYYIDETGHGGKPPHWNHEIYTRKGEGEWSLFEKAKTEHHIIPISEWIEIWARDSTGKVESKKVSRKTLGEKRAH